MIKETNFYFDESDIAHTLVKGSEYTKKQVIKMFKDYCKSDTCVDVETISKDGIKIFESVINVDNSEEVFRIIIHENNFDNNKIEMFELNDIVINTKDRLVTVPQDNVIKENEEFNLNYVNNYLKGIAIITALTFTGLAVFHGANKLYKEYHSRHPQTTITTESDYQKLEDRQNHQDVVLQMKGDNYELHEKAVDQVERYNEEVEAENKKQMEEFEKLRDEDTKSLVIK